MLSSKQEAFAYHVSLGTPLIEAFKLAGYSANGKPTTLYPKASKLAKMDNVRTRIVELQARSREDLAWDRARLVSELHATAMLAREAGQHGDCTQALTQIGKALGLSEPSRVDVRVGVELSGLSMDQLIRLASIPAPGPVDFLEVRATALPSGPEDPAAPE